MAKLLCKSLQAIHNFIRSRLRLRIAPGRLLGVRPDERRAVRHLGRTLRAGAAQAQEARSLSDPGVRARTGRHGTTLRRQVRRPLRRPGTVRRSPEHDSGS